MRRQLVLLLLLAMLLPPGAIVLTQARWACDGGSNDMLRAAQDARVAGDLARAADLAKQAEDICKDVSPPRQERASILRTKLEASVVSTATPTESDVIWHRIDNLLRQSQADLDAGRFSQALAEAQQALALARQVGGRTREAAALTRISLVYTRQGRYARALDYCSQALVIEREVGDRAGEGATLNNLGIIYYFQGQYAKALDYFDQVLAIEREVGDRVREAMTLNFIGSICRDQGQYAKALDYYNQALAIVREVGERSGEASILNGIGQVYVNQGQYAKALDYYSRALAIVREVGDRLGESTILSNIGGIYYDRGQYAKALDYYNQALAIAREMGGRRGEGTTLNNMGLMYYYQEQYATALNYYNQALAIVRELGDRAGEGTIFNNMGLIYDDQGQYAKAMDYYNQALAIRREVGDRAGEGTTLNNIGGIFYNQGQYAKALDYYNQALATVREVGDRAAEVHVLYGRGLSYEWLNQRLNAIADYKAAIDIIERLLNDAALDSAIASLSAQYQNRSPYHRLAVLLTQSGDFSGALSYAERGRAILARTEVAQKPIDFRANLDQSLLEKDAELRLALDSAQKTLDALRKDVSAPAADVQNAQTALDKARQGYDQNLEAMQLRGGFLARQISQKVASLDQIQANLPDDTALVLYSIGDLKSVVFLITGKTLEAVTLNTTTAQIREQVTAFTSGRRTNVNALAKLYGLMISPIADKLKTKRLIISPDGALNYVPFAALISASGRTLIDDYSLSMVPSATTLVLLKERKPEGSPTSPGLVLAQPSAPGLPRLANARTEATDIAKLLNVQPILDATESDLRAGAKGSQVLTISAHAELDRFAPLFSVIYLKGNKQQDGRVEVREVYELDLNRGNDLVVLSGCNTASGGNGEDFGVLTRAFFAAGAPRVVASLWSVDDEATAYLITTYIAERAQAGNDADALRTAMLATRDKYPEPYFWASFILSGQP